MSNEIEMMNNEIITETIEEVAETAKKSDNKFVKGFGVGVGATIAAIAGIKYILKPAYAKFKAKRADKDVEASCDFVNNVVEDCESCKDK